MINTETKVKMHNPGSSLSFADTCVAVVVAQYHSLPFRTFRFPLLPIEYIYSVHPTLRVVYEIPTMQYTSSNRENIHCLCV